MSDFNFAIQNQIEFQSKLKELGTVISDFRIPFRLIASDFYRSQKKLFLLAGPGLYPPLGGFSPNEVEDNGKTRRQNAELKKRKMVGFDYPMLVGFSKDLRDSTLSRGHRNSVFNLGKTFMEIGTDVSYGKYHQSDGPRTKLPQRKFIFIDGGPADKAKDSAVSGRRDRWINIINDHIKQIVTGRVL